MAGVRFVRQELVELEGGSRAMMPIFRCAKGIGRTRRHIPALVFCVVGLFLCCSAHADSAERDVSLHPGDRSDALFSRDRMSIQLVAGAVFSPFIWETQRPTLDFFQTNLRLGRMLTEPGRERSPLRGCHELVLELTHAVIFSGGGSYMSGVTPLGRYNFVQPDARWVPYVQGGVGVVFTDAYKDKSQDVIGQAFEFTPQFSIGLQYLVGKEWSVDLEGKLEHISNAGMSGRNEGVNGGGIFLGMTYFFDP